jgi:hypothetical protein
LIEGYWIFSITSFSDIKDILTSLIRKDMKEKKKRRLLIDLLWWWNFSSLILILCRAFSPGILYVVKLSITVDLNRSVAYQLILLHNHWYSDIHPKWSINWSRRCISYWMCWLDRRTNWNNDNTGDILDVGPLSSSIWGFTGNFL